MDKPKYVYVNDDDNKSEKKGIKITSGNKPTGMMNAYDLLMYTVLFILLTAFTGWFGIVAAILFWAAQKDKTDYEQHKYRRDHEPYSYEYSESIKINKLKYTDEQKEFLENHPWIFINEKGEYQGKWRYCKKEFYKTKRLREHWSMRHIAETYKEKHPDDPNYLKLSTIGYINSLFEKDRALAKYIRKTQERSEKWKEPFEKIAKEYDLVPYFSDYTDNPNEINVCMNFSYAEYMKGIQNKEDKNER